MKQEELKRKLLIANSSYRTGGDWTIDEWLEIQEMKHKDPEFSKHYKKIANKA